METADVFEKLGPIYEEVKSNDGVLTIPMSRLKEEICDSMRLKSQVRLRLAEGLKNRGLHYIKCNDTDGLPNKDTEELRLYIKGTPAGKIMEAVQMSGRPGDMEIRRLASAEQLKSQADMQNLINQVKAIVAKYDQSEIDD
jgi:hypothetical protein